MVIEYCKSENYKFNIIHSTSTQNQHVLIGKLIRHYFRSTKISSALYRIFSCRQYIKLKNNQCCPYKPRYSLFSSYCSRGNTSCCKHSYLLYQTIEKEVKFLHDTVYFLSIFPEELHHVANIDTYCIKP